MTIDRNELAKVKAHCIVCGDEVSAERVKSRSITCSEHCAKVRKGRLRVGDRGAKCVVCTMELSPARTRFGSITCSIEHGALRKESLRLKSDQRRCRQCRKPSTPVERAAYRRFRSLELTRPDLLYPAAFKRWGGDLASFASALEASFLAKEDAGDDSPGEFNLELVDRRSKDSPAGARSGRPEVFCECTHKRHDHKAKTKKNIKQPCRHLDCNCEMYRPKIAERN